VPIVCPEPFTVVRIPDVDQAVLGNREQQVALLVEPDLRERPLVAWRKSAFKFERAGRDALALEEDRPLQSRVS
jgi:hypothetical protein